MQRFRLPLPSVLFLLFACLLRVSASAQGDLTIYGDALADKWENWSWATVDTASTGAVHAGTKAIAVTPSAWSALALRRTNLEPITTTPYGKLTFWAHGGTTGGQRLRVSALLNDSAQPAFTVGPLVANTWQKIEIRLLDLGADNRTTLTGLWFQEGTGNAQPTFYIDDIALAAAVVSAPPPVVNGMSLYDDSFVNGWQNWSWASVNGAETGVFHSGESSIAVNAAAYSAVFFHHNAFSTEGYANLTFWINGGPTGGQAVKVVALLNEQGQPAVTLPALTPNTWQKVVIPLADLGIANKADLTGIWFQENAGVNQPTFYLDDVYLELAPPPSVINVAVNGKAPIRQVDPRLFALNTAVWDSVFNTATTAELLNEIDNQALRFPGGSASDVYHWKTNMSEGATFQWATDFDDFANIAVATQAQVFITVNYGTGTPEEAADWVRYANVEKGLGFKYWEVGNENYGTWEADNNNRPHDPVTYATRYKEYVRQMKAVDPTIKIGAVVQASEDSDANYTDQTVVNPRTGLSHNGWTAVLFAAFKQLGVTPDFVVYHRYEQAPGGENDAFLLNAALGWKDNASAIRQMLNDYLGTTEGPKVEINCTENNSVYGDPGKQSTSLVNGLYLADSLGNIMKTEFNAMFWWDLRNGQDASKNNSASLYGWRNYGDYGIVNNANPAGPADRYPTFYVYKLLTHYARGGETVLQASSDYNGLGVYAVRDRHKALHLLVINKNRTSTLNASVNVAGFNVGPQANVYTYGIPQDEAARNNTGNADVAMSTRAIAGTTFTYAAPPYSATVIQLKGNQAANLSITRGGFTLNRRTSKMVQTVTIKNTGTEPVDGPIHLMLESLSANTWLTNATGATTALTPLNSPYVLVSANDLAPGASKAVVLEFAVPASGGITYTPRALAAETAP